MNARQRFLLTMDYRKSDRPPLFEEGIREQVLETWREQGLRNCDLSQIFQYDYREEIEPNLNPIPDIVAWPRAPAELRGFERRLDPHDSRRLPADWERRVERWQSRDYPLILRVHRGFFQTMGVDDWERFIAVIYLLKDEPSLVRGILEIQANFAAQMAEKILGDVRVDAALFSEPIGGNHGPLISPQMYSEFLMPGYRHLLSILRRHGVKTTIIRTYANARVLLPPLVQAGFNCLWACECAPGAMEYREIRMEYGRDLSLIGGIDTDWLYQDPELIRPLISEVVLSLLAKGGYLPLADGRVRAGVPFEHYAAYRHLLEQLVA